MTALKTELLARITAQGPLTMAEYMAECLLHPTHGYYTTRDPFGAAGDFITAPEISQMFGEVIGLALAQAWLDQESPTFTLAELGPGRGTLMADIWRATAGVPGFHEAADIVLVEASPALQNVQRQAVPQARHIAQVSDLPDAPLFLVANEFFDALPVRQFIRQGAGWEEVRIGASDDTLLRQKTQPTPVPALQDRREDTADGDLIEHCPALPGIMTEITRRITAHGGAALIIDYGDWASLGDTVQAMRNHAPTDLLAEPGLADITAHVDFAALAASAGETAHSRLTPQGVFLERLGITARAQALAQKLSGEALSQHIAAHRRLTHPAEMGDHFKVLGFWPRGATPLPGLQP